MSPEERQLLQGLFDRMRSQGNNPRDREAEQMIADNVRQQPYAPYLLSQTVIVQDQALQAANQKMQALEQQVQELQQHAPAQRAAERRVPVRPVRRRHARPGAATAGAALGLEPGRRHARAAAIRRATRLPQGGKATRPAAGLRAATCHSRAGRGAARRMQQSGRRRLPAWRARRGGRRRRAACSSPIRCAACLAATTIRSASAPACPAWAAALGGETVTNNYYGADATGSDASQDAAQDAAYTSGGATNADYQQDADQDQDSAQDASDYGVDDGGSYDT